MDNNNQNNNNSYSSIKQGRKALTKGINTTGNTIRLLSKTLLGKIFIFFLILLLFISIILTGTSTVQMEDSYGISPYNNLTVSPAMKEAVTNKDVSVKRTQTMMDTVSKVMSDDYDYIKNHQIKTYIRKHGYDEELSLSSIVTIGASQDEMFYEENKNTPADKGEDKEKDKNKTDSIQKEEDNTTKGKVIQTFDLSDLSDKNRKTMTYENFFRNLSSNTFGWAASTFQGKYARNQENYTVDNYGLMRNKKGQDDFLCALGSYFGNEGNRYRITFNNGRSYTFLKFDEKASKDTVNNKYHSVDGSVLEFLVDQNGFKTKLHPKMRSGNIINHPEQLFNGGIKSIELIEGEVAVDSTGNGNAMSPRILAAYSVYFDNLYHTKTKDGLVDSNGKKLSKDKANELYGLNTSDFFKASITYAEMKDADNTILKKKLKEYLKNGKNNHFYKVHYKEETGTKEKIVKEDISNWEQEAIDSYLLEHKDFKLVEKNGKKQIVKVESVKYCIPTIYAEDIDMIAEKVFNLNPNDKYVNDKDITVSDAIDNISIQTSALLFDADFDGAIVEGDGIYTGSFQNPLKPAGYTITTVYEWRWGKFHGAIDLATRGHGNISPPIFAADGGTVEYAGPHPTFGNYVKINHGNGFATIYAHQRKVIVKTGQKVSKGQVLGYVGNTGNSTGPHLHFEIRRKNKQVNPQNYIKF